MVCLDFSLCQHWLVKHWQELQQWRLFLRPLLLQDHVVVWYLKHQGGQNLTPPTVAAVHRACCFCKLVYSPCPLTYQTLMVPKKFTKVIKKSNVVLMTWNIEKSWKHWRAALTLPYCSSNIPMHAHIFPPCSENSGSFLWSCSKKITRNHFGENLRTV